MMMTRLASIAPKSSGLLAIPTRAFGNLNKCPNSKFGLGMSDILKVKNSLDELDKVLRGIKDGLFNSGSSSECITTHQIVKDMMDKLQKQHRDTVAEAEAKLIANQLKSDPMFEKVSWKDLF